MDLVTLLEHLAKDYLDDRTELVDGDGDSLWSDALLVRYLNEAQRILARRAWCIVEYGVAPAGVITLRTGVSLYPVHKSILKVYDGTPSTQAYPLGRANDTMIRSVSLVYDFDAFEIGVSAALNSTADTGATTAIASDAGSRMLRVYPTPTATENGVQVAIKIARLPITWLTVDDTAASPEVPEDYHFLLCTYAAGKALTQPNVDGAMKTDGRLLLAEFDAAVKEARQDRQRFELGSSRWAFSSSTADL